MPQEQEKPPFGGFVKFEDAKVGLLVSFLAFLQIRNLSTTYLNPSSNLFLYRATWHSTPDFSEFLKNVPFAPPIGSRFSLSLQVLPPASTAPNTGEGSDLHSQGGCQQANLLAMRLSPHP